MAVSAYEYYVSRTGSSFGVFGGNALTSTWLVNPGGDTTINPAEWLASNNVPLGSPFPWPAFGLVALQYTLGERKGPVWEVHVQYGPPVYLPGQRWRMSFRGSLEIEDAYVDRAGQEIGLHDWEKADDASQGFDGFITTKTGNQYLKKNGIVSKPYQRRKKVAHMALTTRIAYLNDTAIPNALREIGTINQSVFYGAEAGTLMFEGCEIEQNFQAGGEQTPDGSSWDISLIFAWNLDGWDIELREEYLDTDKGIWKPVLSSGTTAQRIEVKPYWESDFYAILSEFIP